jgi:hypothetical protein
MCVMCVPDIMECGGKRSAAPLCRKSRQVVRQNQQSLRGPKRRRRCALPAHSIGSAYFRSTLDTSWCELCIKMRAEACALEHLERGIYAASVQDKLRDVALFQDKLRDVALFQDKLRDVALFMCVDTDRVHWKSDRAFTGAATHTSLPISRH